MPSGTYTYFIIIFSDDIAVATLPHPPITDPLAIMGQSVLHWLRCRHNNSDSVCDGGVEEGQLSR